MNKLRAYIIIAAMLLPVFGAVAQPFRAYRDRNLWNAGRNVNGVRTDSVTVSYAEISGGYESGKYRNVNEAASLWNAGAEAATITHFDKISMTGSFSFRHSDARDMCGSMLSRPGYYPVDILEFTPGRKTRQVYNIAGGITADIAENWRIGGAIDIENENYTKRKDLRHSNYRLDLSFVPSVMWHKGDIAAGASYIFSRTSETAKAEELGITSGSYYAFLDKGLRYGVMDVWDNSGLHISEAGVTGFPIAENSNGAALQFQWKGLYIDAEYGHRNGKIGEKQKVWYNFGGDKFATRIAYKLQTPAVTHYFTGTYSFTSTENRENILEDVTENGVTLTWNYGSNTVLLSNTHDAAVSWEVRADDFFRFGLGLDWNGDRKAASVLYPYVSTRKTDRLDADCWFWLPYRRFSLGGSLGLHLGWMKDATRTVSDEVVPGSEPVRLTEYYDIEREYITTPAIRAELSLRYIFRRNIYIEARAREIGALKDISNVNGKSRLSVGLAVGYNF
ncbi:MAG: DUF6850 family outer membrane beta-barrel protein [Candidatus Cryptobacteroides sp.]